MAKAGNWNSIPGFLNQFLTLWTLDKSLQPLQRCKMKPAGRMTSQIHASLRFHFFAYNQRLDIDGGWQELLPFWTLSPAFPSWHLLCTQGSRFQMCSQTTSGSCRRHPSILFIKLGSSIVANMQWLESCELATLESLSTFETGTRSLSWTERHFKL